MPQIQRLTISFNYYKNKEEYGLLGRAYLCRSINRYKSGRYSPAISDAMLAEKLLPSDDKFMDVKCSCCWDKLILMQNVTDYL